MSRTEELAAALAEVEERLQAACAHAGRDRSDVLLVAVSKTRPASDIELLRGLGVTDFGENRDQEAGPKTVEVPGARWHFVGSLQTNKAASVARYADVVHSVDRSRLVAALSAGAVRAGRHLDVLLQVDLAGVGAGAGAGERGGVLPTGVDLLADEVAAAPGLCLAGVMAVAPLDADPRAAFALLSEVSGRVRAAHPSARTISAGMSGDLEQAVAAGSTMVRVGTALFGRRPPVLR